MDSPDDFPTMAATQHAASLIMGPNQAGYLVQLLLFGVFLQMFFSYWRSGELAQHTRSARWALLASLVLNTLYTMLCFQQAYFAGVTQDRTRAALEDGDDLWNALPLLNGLASISAQSFLTARAGALIQDRRLRWAFWCWIGGLVCLLLFGCTVTTVDAILYSKGFEEDQLVISYNGASAIWLFSSAATDLSISLACAWALRSRIRGFSPETDTLLRRLTFIFVRTAAYTTIASLLAAILFAVYKEDDLNAYIAYATWTPGGALSALSLFTFAGSSRRAITNRLGSSGDMPGGPGSVYIRRPALGTGSGKVRSSVGPGIALQHLSRTGDAAPAPVPLQISVQHQSVVHYEGPDDEDVSTKGGLDSEKEARDFAV